MAIFCTKCGKRLEEGQVCECKQEKNNTQAPTKDSNVNASTVVNDYIEIVKGLFISPTDIVKKYATSDKFILGIIAMVINCLVSGLYFYFFAGKLFNGLLGMFSGSILVSSSLPFFKVFLMGILFMLVWFLVCAPVIYIIANPILKDEIDIKASFALTGVCSVFTTLTTLVALLFIFISPRIALIITLLGATFYLSYLYQGLSDVTKVDRNKLAYIFVPAVGLATFLMVEIVPRLFG